MLHHLPGRLRRAALRMAAVLVLGWLGGTGAASAVDLRTHPLAPVDTTSPRATLQSFREDIERTYRSWRLRENLGATTALGHRALRTLDLANVGQAIVEDIGIGAAFYLHDTLSRIELPPPGEIPDADAVAARGLTRWTVPGTEITITKVADGDRAGEWLFSTETVRRAPEFRARVQDRPLLHGAQDMIDVWLAAPGLLMPDAVAKQIWELPPPAFVLLASQPLWKWTAAALSALLAAGLAALLWRAGRKWDKRCRKRESGWPIGQPLALLAAIGILAALELVLERVILFRLQPGAVASVVITIVRYALVAWLVATLITGLGGLVVDRAAASRKGLDAALIRLCFRIFSILAALAVVLHAVATLGISVTPILAGLGVGGLAVALAIRPTLENLIGGFVLFADKPVRVGEFCSFGDKMGTVEEIGLRSTRLRALDRTVITVPNADFAQMQIVNFTRRDMNLFQCQIGLRYETTPEQLRYVAAKIRKLLIQHSKVSPDPARVRLSSFGDSAYLLDLFAFVRAADWNEFLAIKEDLNLRIAEIVRDAGTSFAFPSQTIYFARDGGVDRARAAATEAEVRHWREDRRLPFPDYDYAEKVEMEDTLPYPPEGSPDYRPAPARAADTASDRPAQGRPGGWRPLFRRKLERTPS